MLKLNPLVPKKMHPITIINNEIVKQTPLHFKKLNLESLLSLTFSPLETSGISLDLTFINKPTLSSK